MAKEQTTESGFDFSDASQAEIESDKLRPEFANLKPLVQKSFNIRLLELRKVEEIRSYDMEGKIRIAKVDCVQEGDGGPGSKMVLAKLPGGKLRVLGRMCYLEQSSSTPFTIGWASHRTSLNVLVHEMLDGFDGEVEIGERFLELGTNLVAQTEVFDTQMGLDVIADFPHGVEDKTTITGYLVYVQS